MVEQKMQIGDVVHVEGGLLEYREWCWCWHAHSQPTCTFWRSSHGIWVNALNLPQAVLTTAELLGG